MEWRSNVDKTVQLNKFYLKQWQPGVSFYLLYIIILFKFEVAILQIMSNMASSNINLTLRVTGRMIFPLAFFYLIEYS